VERTPTGQRLDDGIQAQLFDRLDAVSCTDGRAATRVLEHDDIARIRDGLNRLHRTRIIEPPCLSLWRASNSGRGSVTQLTW
jgi:hypothetical protein